MPRRAPGGRGAKNRQNRGLTGNFGHSIPRTTPPLGKNGLPAAKPPGQILPINVEKGGIRESRELREQDAFV
jgi:hypothetical protein